MKREALLKHLRKYGCYLKREGRSHSLWMNLGKPRFIRTQEPRRPSRAMSKSQIVSPARYATISLSRRSVHRVFAALPLPGHQVSSDQFLEELKRRNRLGV